MLERLKSYVDVYRLVREQHRVIQSLEHAMTLMSEEAAGREDLLAMMLIGAVAANGGKVEIKNELFDKITEGGVDINKEVHEWGVSLELVDMEGDEE